MNQQKLKEEPISLGKGGKTNVRTQFAALCYRVDEDKTKVLLITSRGTGRWVIPKGWPLDGKTPADAALTEAWEEAGVKGKVTGSCLGLFSYQKDLQKSDDLPCVAMVYPVRVDTLKKTYPEVDQRDRKWFTPKKAAEQVTDPELAQILRQFDPARLAG